VAGRSPYVPILTQSLPGGLVATHTARGLSHLALRFCDFVEFCYHAGMVAYSKSIYAGEVPGVVPVSCSDKMGAWSGAFLIASSISIDPPRRRPG
jgi:hypothetical protein